MCIFNDYPRFLDKVIRDHLATYRSCREQVESCCEDDCNDGEPIEKVIYVHEVSKFNDNSLSCEDVCIVDEPLFLDELFKDECDHSGEKTRVEDFKSRVLIGKKQAQK